MNKGSTIVAFVVGLGIGSAATWFYAKKRYETIINEEVSSARETYNQLGKELIEKNNRLKDKMFEKFDEELSEDLKVYENIVEKEYIEDEVVFEEKPQVKVVSPSSHKNNPYDAYEITEEEYGSDDLYSLISLTYFSDGIITDDFDEIVDDSKSILGENIYDILDNYENNSEVDIVHFRNDVRRSDYQILLARCNFNE